MISLFDVFIQLLRASPAIIFSLGLVLYVITTLDIYLILSIVTVLGEMLNTILKTQVFKPIMKGDYWPILGYGTRPVGSKNSAQFGDINIPPNKHSYGMPSGHSQTTVAFAIFMILTLINHHDTMSNAAKYIIGGIVVLYAVLVLWSRSYLKCHTIQQIIIGSCIGLIVGYYGYLYGDMFIKTSQLKSNVTVGLTRFASVKQLN